MKRPQNKQIYKSRCYVRTPPTDVNSTIQRQQLHCNRVAVFSARTPPPHGSAEYAQIQVKVKVTLRLTISQSVSKSWCPATSGAYDQIFFPFGIRNTSDSYVLHSVGRPFWREDGFVFCICRWPLPAQSFLVVVPRDLGPYFTVSDLRLPFYSSPTTRRVMVEVFDPASTRLSGQYEIHTAI
jgi:hypothetical protein